jgi:hypothetical protein
MFSLLTAEHSAPSLVGVVHLMALPGAPTQSPGLETVIARATADAQALEQGGADGVIIENLGDAPFTAGRVDAFTVAAMTRIVLAVRRAAPRLGVGVNVLRNDAVSALSIAAATGADFIRVNVLTGAMVTDQGLIQGCARELLLERRRLGMEVRIAADVLVKHAVPLGDAHLGDVARDTWHRGGADALIITGRGTGRPTDPSDVITARQAAPDASIWLGSGLDPERAAAVRDHIDVAIVGTWLHAHGDLSRPVQSDRVAEMKSSLAR